MRGVALAVAFAVFAAAAVAHPDVQMLGDEAAPSSSARAAALEKVKALITPSKSKGKKNTSGLAAKLKQVKEQDGKKIAKYKFKASTAAKREDIKLHKGLNQQKELFVKKMKHAATYKAKLAAVAKRAAKAVAQADVQADKETAKLRVVARKASYAKAAEKTIAVLQTKLKSSGKATEMVAAKLKVDDKKIGKLRATIDGLKNGVKGQASKVAKAKEGKAKAKKKVKEGKVKAKAKASKNKGKAAKHKLSAQKAKEKTSKAKAKASKHKAKAKKAVRKAAHKPKSGGSIESRIKHEKKLARAAHHRAASLHIKASVVHAKVGSKKAAAAAQSAAKASKAAANHKRLQSVTKLAKKINKKKKKAKKGKKGRKKKAKKKAKKAAKKAKKKAKKRAAKKKAKKKKHE